MQKTRDSVASRYDVVFIFGNFLLGCKKIFEELHGKFDETPESLSKVPYLDKNRNLHQMFDGYLIFEAHSISVLFDCLSFRE